MKIHTKECGSQLIDCGSVRRMTRGLPIGFFFEAAQAPFDLTFNPPH
jgi:hypothetical protein